MRRRPFRGGGQEGGEKVPGGSREGEAICSVEREGVERRGWEWW